MSTYIANAASTSREISTLYTYGGTQWYSIANHYSFLASKFELQIYEHSNNIWQLHVEVSIWSFLGTFILPATVRVFHITWFIEVVSQPKVATDTMFLESFSAQINSKNLILSLCDTWGYNLQWRMGVRKDFYVNEMWNISQIYHVYYCNGTPIHKPHGLS
jgi:hypothetical protein